MVSAERKDIFYEFCIEEGYYIEGAGGDLLERVKKAFRDIIEKIKSIFTSKKMKEVNMNDTVQVPKESLSKVDKFINALKTFVSKLGSFIKNNKAVSIATITVLTTFTVGELKRRKDAKVMYGMVKKSDLKKRLNELERGSEQILKRMDDDLLRVGIDPRSNYGKKIKKEGMELHTGIKNGLKLTSTTTGYTLNMLYRISQAIPPIIKWVMFYYLAVKGGEAVGEKIGNNIARHMNAR